MKGIQFAMVLLVILATGATFSGELRVQQACVISMRVNVIQQSMTFDLCALARRQIVDCAEMAST